MLFKIIVGIIVLTPFVMGALYALCLIIKLIIDIFTPKKPTTLSDVICVLFGIDALPEEPKKQTAEDIEKQKEDKKALYTLLFSTVLGVSLALIIYSLV